MPYRVKISIKTLSCDSQLGNCALAGWCQQDDAHTLTHTHTHYTHTHTHTHTHIHTHTHTHTHYTPAVAVSVTSWAPSVSSAAFCWRKTSNCWRLSTSLKQGALGKTSVGSGRVKGESGWQKHFSFGQAKYSAGDWCLCTDCEAVHYSCKAPKKFDGSVLHVKHTLVGGSEVRPL